MTVGKRVRSEFVPEQPLMEMNIYSFVFRMHFAAQNKSICSICGSTSLFSIYNLLLCLVLLKQDTVLMYT